MGCGGDACADGDGGAGGEAGAEGAASAGGDAGAAGSTAALVLICAPLSFYRFPATEHSRAPIATSCLTVTGVQQKSHERVTQGRCPLVGYGPVNPYQWTMTADLYTTDMAPTFHDMRAVPVPQKVPVSSADRERPPAPRTGSKPSIVLPPPNTIPNPQLTPPHRAEMVRLLHASTAGTGHCTFKVQ